MLTKGSVALAKKVAATKRLRRDLAYRCDVSEQTVRNWESGACVPRYRYRPVIEDVTGVSVALWERPLEVAA